MKFEMTTPCVNCPFRTDVRPFLHPERAREIADCLVRHQSTFPCHKTVNYDDDGEGTIGEQSQHCAGALIVLEKINKPNQMMRIAERLGMYDRRKLAMEAPVFRSMLAFVRAQRSRGNR